MLHYVVVYIASFVKMSHIHCHILVYMGDFYKKKFLFVFIMFYILLTISSIFSLPF